MAIMGVLKGSMGGGTDLSAPQKIYERIEGNESVIPSSTGVQNLAVTKGKWYVFAYFRMTVNSSCTVTGADNVTSFVSQKQYDSRWEHITIFQATQDTISITFPSGSNIAGGQIIQLD